MLLVFLNQHCSIQRCQLLLHFHQLNLVISLYLFDHHLVSLQLFVTYLQLHQSLLALHFLLITQLSLLLPLCRNLLFQIHPHCSIQRCWLLLHFHLIVLVIQIYQYLHHLTRLWLLVVLLLLHRFLLVLHSLQLTQLLLLLPLYHMQLVCLHRRCSILSLFLSLHSHQQDFVELLYLCLLRLTHLSLLVVLLLLHLLLLALHFLLITQLSLLLLPYHMQLVCLHQHCSIQRQRLSLHSHQISFVGLLCLCLLRLMHLLLLVIQLSLHRFLFVIHFLSLILLSLLLLLCQILLFQLHQHCSIQNYQVCFLIRLLSPVMVSYQLQFH